MKLNEETPGYVRNLLAIDFDGTIVEHKFPAIGPFLPDALVVLNALKDYGYKLILNTCREDEKNRKYLSEAIEHMLEHGITFRSINENHPDDEFRAGPKARKVYAHCYIDDRNIGGFIGWRTVAKLLLPGAANPFQRKRTTRKVV